MTRPVIHLHIGAMKTGTTYLQQVMIANRDALEAAGHHFALRIWARQVHAVQDLLQLDRNDERIVSLSAGAWPRLVADVLDPPGGAATRSSVVSMEFLSFARNAAVRRVARDLAEAEVHVVLTLRDATSTIPAQWQTSITSGARHSWADFQTGVRRSAGPLGPLAAARLLRDSGAREFRRTQDTGRMLATWGRLVPPERFHVVLMPRGSGDPDELWRRFAAATGIDPALAVEPAARSNPSLGFASTELVRRINLGLTDVSVWDFNRTVKGPLAAGILGERRGLEGTAVPDAATSAFARDWNQRARDLLVRGGYPVVGDLEHDLPVDAPDPKRGASATAPSTVDVLDAARAAHAGLTRLVVRRRRRVARILGADPPQPLPDDGADWLREGRTGPADLDRAVLDLTTLTRTAIGLRREMAELREDRATREHRERDRPDEDRDADDDDRDDDQDDGTDD